MTRPPPVLPLTRWMPQLADYRTYVLPDEHPMLQRVPRGSGAIDSTNKLIYVRARDVAAWYALRRATQQIKKIMEKR